MITTNREQLSEGLVRAIQYSKYDKGQSDFSATELIAPSRIVALSRRHHEEIEEDVSDVIYRMFGSIGHAIAERSKLNAIGENSKIRTQEIIKVIDLFLDGKIEIKSLFDKMKDAIDLADAIALSEKGLMVEQRLFAQIDLNGTKYTISGQIDEYYIESGEIDDYKICSRWVSIDGGKDEWVAQLNIYAWLLRKNGHNPRSARVQAIYRDWSKSQALRDKSYPQSQVEVIPIELWPDEDVEQYVKKRVASHVQAMAEIDEKKIAVCTPEERWQRQGEFAVTKEGRKRAIKLFDTREDANIWINKYAKDGEELIIEERRGQSIRCAMYCPVYKHCSYWKYYV